MRCTYNDGSSALLASPSQLERARQPSPSVWPCHVGVHRSCCRAGAAPRRSHALPHCRRIPGLAPRQVTDGRDARGLKDALAKEHGIMVRHYSTKVRVSCLRYGC